MNNIIEIGESCSPSTPVSIDTEDVTRFTIKTAITADRVVYATSIEKDGVFYSLMLIDGTDLDVNESFVVSKKPMKIVTQVTDITAHRNYHGKTCDKAIESRQFVINQNQTPLLVDRMICNHECGNIVRSWVDKS